MVKTIFLRQVLEKMNEKDKLNKPIPFSIEVRTFNSNNKTGGELKVYKDAVLLLKESNGQVFNPMEHSYRQIRERRNPNHWDNRTRNIELKSGFIRKIKILYITKFNDMDVVY